MTTPSADQHGTYKDYQRHKRRGQVPCEPCREAQRAYMRNLRATNEGTLARDRAQRTAHRIAQTRLREAHREEFDRLYAAALREQWSLADG